LVLNAVREYFISSDDFQASIDRPALSGIGGMENEFNFRRFGDEETILRPYTKYPIDRRAPNIFMIAQRKLNCAPSSEI